MAVCAGGQLLHYHVALRFGDVPDLPLDQGDGGLGQRSDRAVIRGSRGAEGYIAIEDGCADGIARGRYRYVAGRDRRFRVPCNPADRNGGGRVHRELFDGCPCRLVGLPCVRRGLLWRQLRAGPSVRVKLTDLQGLSGRFNAYWLGAASEGNIDQPACCCLAWVVPEERGSRDIRREDRPVQRIIYLDFRGIRSDCCRFRSGVSSNRSTANEGDSNDDKDPGEEAPGRIETLIIPNGKHTSHSGRSGGRGPPTFFGLSRRVAHEDSKTRLAVGWCSWRRSHCRAHR